MSYDDNGSKIFLIMKYDKILEERNLRFDHLMSNEVCYEVFIKILWVFNELW